MNWSQAQQSDPSLEEFLNGLGEEAGVSTEAEDGTMLTASEECNVTRRSQHRC